MSEQNQEQKPAPEQKPNSVDALEKKVQELIEEKRKAQAKADEAFKRAEEFEKKVKLSEIEKLELQGNKDAVIEKLKQEKSEYESKIKQAQEEKIKSAKFNALKSELLKNGADTKSIEFLLKGADIDKMKYDEDHKIVLGVDTVAKEIRESIPSAFGKQNAPQMNDQAPDVTGNVTSMDAWLKLPLKERKDPKKAAEFFKSMGFEPRK